MADYVTVANLALSLIGENDQLRDPDEDSAPARAVRAVWDRVRRAVLRDHPWNFAIERRTLPALNEAVIGFTHAFLLPTGCLRFLEILEPLDIRDTYQIENGRILANAAGPIAVRYVADRTDVSTWDDLFIDAFAAKLAHQIADRITGDLDRQDAMEKIYSRRLSSATATDARENPPIPHEDSDWLLARFGT